MGLLGDLLGAVASAGEHVDALAVHQPPALSINNSHKVKTAFIPIEALAGYLGGGVSSK